MARAETHIQEGSLFGSTIWTKAASPYILDGDITVPKGAILTLNPGVIVTSASSSPHEIDMYGVLHTAGSDTDPVRILGLSGIYVVSSPLADISYTWFEGSTLDIEYSTSTIVASKFMDSESNALYAKKSYVTIDGSEIRDNQTGIYSALFAPPQQVYNWNAEEGIGGIGNALSDDPNQNHITIHNSIFERNKDYGIKNMVSNTIDATNNWWGNSSGPGTAVSGAIVTDPWLLKDPRVKKIECCSSVLFLPGLEASRLYRDDPDLLGGTFTTHRSWEPYTSNDVKKIFLGPGGTAIGSTTIYVGDILGSAYGLVGIYSKFVAMMNSVVADKTIQAWLPFAYDWRMSPNTVLDGTLYATTTKKLVDEVMKLASDSKTGKVTIVAHSNGGLVAKTLGRELERIGKADLIDKVIMVAVPELGTPQAVAGMLHGDSQELLKGFILRAGVARTLGLNLPGAYNLLPSQEYFNRVVEPVITFAGKAVGTYTSFTNFLTGKTDKRMQPPDSDVKSPAVLSSDLISKSITTHLTLDTWHFPTTTAVVSLVGWGTPTTETVAYSTSSPVIRKGPEGDGTVIAASAAGYSGENAGDNVYFNQGLFNHDLKKDITHANILEADPLREFISKLIATSSLGTVLSKPLPQYLTQIKPNPDHYSWMSWLTVSVHSPVDMDIYDSHGGHMGLVPLPTDPTSDIMYFENTIGGQYDAIGDEKYYTLPSNDTYTVSLKGTGTGNFSFEVQKFVGGNMTQVSDTVYADLPVTPLLAATTTINSLAAPQPLNLDIDGDGKTDIKALPSRVINPFLHLAAIRTLILSLHLSPQIQSLLLQRIERIIKAYPRDKRGRMTSRLLNFRDVKDEAHWWTRGLTATRRNSLYATYNALLTTLEADL